MFVPTLFAPLFEQLYSSIKGIEAKEGATVTITGGSITAMQDYGVKSYWGATLSLSGTSVRDISGGPFLSKVDPFSEYISRQVCAAGSRVLDDRTAYRGGSLVSYGNLVITDSTILATGGAWAVQMLGCCDNNVSAGLSPWGTTLSMSNVKTNGVRVVASTANLTSVTISNGMGLSVEDNSRVTMIDSNLLSNALQGQNCDMSGTPNCDMSNVAKFGLRVRNAALDWSGNTSFDGTAVWWHAPKRPDITFPADKLWATGADIVWLDVTDCATKGDLPADLGPTFTGARTVRLAGNNFNNSVPQALSALCLTVPTASLVEQPHLSAVFPDSGELPRYLTGCSGLPPDDCGAFGNAAVSTQIVGTCVECPYGQLVTALLLIAIVVAGIAAFSFYFWLISKFPNFKGWVATSKIIIGQLQIAAVVAMLKTLNGSLLKVRARLRARSYHTIPCHRSCVRSPHTKRLPVRACSVRSRSAGPRSSSSTSRAPRQSASSRQ